MQSILQRSIVKVGRFEADAGAESQHLISAHLIFQLALTVGKHFQSIGLIRAGKQHLPQRGVARAILGLRHHEDIADQRAFDEKSRGADEHEFANFLRVSRGDLGSDPAADAAAYQIKLGQLQGVENFKIVKNHVLDNVDVFILVRLRAAGVGRRDHLGVLRQFFMKGYPAFFHRVDIGEAMKIKQRGAFAGFQNPNLAFVDLESATAQWSASGACSTLAPGNSSVNCFKESWRSAGATFSANNFMLLRASWSGILPS